MAPHRVVCGSAAAVRAALAYIDLRAVDVRGVHCYERGRVLPAQYRLYSCINPSIDAPSEPPAENRLDGVAEPSDSDYVTAT